MKEIGLPALNGRRFLNLLPLPITGSISNDFLLRPFRIGVGLLGRASSLCLSTPFPSPSGAYRYFRRPEQTHCPRPSAKYEELRRGTPLVGFGLEVSLARYLPGGRKIVFLISPDNGLEVYDIVDNVKWRFYRVALTHGRWLSR